MDKLYETIEDSSPCKKFHPATLQVDENDDNITFNFNVHISDIHVNLYNDYVTMTDDSDNKADTLKAANDKLNELIAGIFKVLISIDSFQFKQVDDVQCLMLFKAVPSNILESIVSNGLDPTAPKSEPVGVRIKEFNTGRQYFGQSIADSLSYYDNNLDSTMLVVFLPVSEASSMHFVVDTQSLNGGGHRETFTCTMIPARHIYMITYVSLLLKLATITNVVDNTITYTISMDTPNEYDDTNNNISWATFDTKFQRKITKQFADLEDVYVETVTDSDTTPKKM